MSSPRPPPTREGGGMDARVGVFNYSLCIASVLTYYNDSVYHVLRFHVLPYFGLLCRIDGFTNSMHTILTKLFLTT